MKFSEEQQRAILKTVGEWYPDVEEHGDILRDEIAMALGNAMGMNNEDALRLMESEREESARQAERMVQGWSQDIQI